VNEDEIDSGQREGLTTEEKEELRNLRREVKILRQEIFLRSVETPRVASYISDVTAYRTREATR